MIQSDSSSMSRFEPTLTPISWAKSTPFHFLSIKFPNFQISTVLSKLQGKGNWTVYVDCFCLFSSSLSFIFSVSSFAIRNIFHLSSNINSVSMSTQHFLGENHGSYSSHLYAQTLLINNAPTFAHIPFYGEVLVETFLLF